MVICMQKRFDYLNILEDKLKTYRTGKIDPVTRISWGLNYRVILKKAFNVSIKGHKILDVGCGGGGYIIALAKKKRECYGVDPLLAISLAKAHKKAKEEKAKIFLCKAVGEFLPYKSQIFDVVLCLSTLQHVGDQEKMLREIRRVLQNNGKLLMSIPTTRNIHTFFREVIPSHFSAGFNITTVRKLLTREGFQISEVKGSGFFPPFLNKVLQFFHVISGETITKKVIETLDKIADKWLSSAGNLMILSSKLSP
jgi:2-polyprenyl-3-methyl-5-hydroxy-6-metoxy-1,4-benzoquinol methylase